MGKRLLEAAVLLATGAGLLYGVVATADSSPTWVSESPLTRWIVPWWSSLMGLRPAALILSIALIVVAVLLAVGVPITGPLKWLGHKLGLVRDAPHSPRNCIPAVREVPQRQTGAVWQLAGVAELAGIWGPAEPEEAPKRLMTASQWAARAEKAADSTVQLAEDAARLKSSVFLMSSLRMERVCGSEGEAGTAAVRQSRPRTAATVSSSSAT